MIISKIDVCGIGDVEKRLGSMKKNAPIVVSRAINRATKNAKKNMAKETSSHYYITSNDVKKTIHVTKATKTRLQAAVISEGSGIALAKFKVTPKTPVKYRGLSRTPKVYRASVKKSGGLKALDGTPKAFVAKMQSGHIGVFSRVSKKSFPIQQLYGPSVPQMVKNKEIIDKIRYEANKTLQKRIDAEIDNILRKG